MLRFIRPWREKAEFRAQELCESRGGRPWLPVPNSPFGFCGRQATLRRTNRNYTLFKGRGEKGGRGNGSFFAPTTVIERLTMSHLARATNLCSRVVKQNLRQDKKQPNKTPPKKKKKQRVLDFTPHSTG